MKTNLDYFLDGCILLTIGMLILFVTGILKIPFLLCLAPVFIALALCYFFGGYK